MRALLLTLIIFSSIPFILVRPYVGLLVYSWISFMSPHRLTFGFAYDFPFAMLIGVVFLGSWLISKEPKKPPLNAVCVLTIVFTLWMCVTTVFAFAPDAAFTYWKQVSKIMLISIIAMILLTDRRRIDGLIWVIVGSIGFFGLKGGVFTILGGASSLVYGPPGSMIEENNAMALATITILPLVRYLHLQATNRYLRWGLLAAMPILLFSALGSHSRGGFLAIVAMVGYMLLQPRRNFVAGIAMAVMLVVTINFLPQKWFDRMETITAYEQDASAMGRINAWTMGINLALDRPIVGGGLKVFDSGGRPVWQKYAPDPDNARSSHNIYIQVLGNHGFPGLFLYLGIMFMVFRYGGWLIKRSRDRPDLRWAGDWGAMSQVSLVGYAVGGIFLNVAYYDLFWMTTALVVGARVCVGRQLAENPDPDQIVAAPNAQPDTALAGPHRSFLRKPGKSTGQGGYLRG